MILAWTGDKSYRADKLKTGLILTFKLNLTLKVKVNQSPKQ